MYWNHLGFHSASSTHTSCVTLSRLPNLSELNILMLTMKILCVLWGGLKDVTRSYT